jgi:pyruvate dehydrogenase E2 component (dihydrolipoamide acetyltransferase)
MESATLVTWLVKPGDTVKRGDVVASVETTKGIIDIEIFDAGVVEKLVVTPGTEVAVGELLATYRPEAGAPAAAAKEAVTAPAPAAASPAVAPLPGARQAVSPLARKRAAELGVDLDALTPHDGRPISVQDVEQAAAAKPVTPPQARKPEAVADMRQQIALSMSRSKREIPHYYLATTIDFTNASRWLEATNATLPVTERLLYGVLLIKAVARALEGFPDLNGFWRDGTFAAANSINVGTAIRLHQGGLVAPALIGANRLPLSELMRNFRDLVLRARTGRLRATELASATITLTSLGEGNVETVYPIIHPPQVAIIGFGSVVVRPWCAAGAVIPAPVLSATLAADHRVTDGTRGSAFLMAVTELLQHPESL